MKWTKILGILGVMVFLWGAAPYRAATQINPGDFVKEINNPLLPMKPGTTYVFQTVGSPDEDRDVVEITSDTKVIEGVTCVVVKDTVTFKGQLVEGTFDWYAQDTKGNVWYFGEDTKQYKNGQVVSTEGSWESGVNGAAPGIIMEAHPAVGDQYQQEFAKGVAEDMAKVLSLDASVTVPAGTYEHLLHTYEWTPLEPGAAEEKFFAAGIGQVLGKEVKGGHAQDQLIEIHQAAQ